MPTINHISIMQNEVVDYLIKDLNGIYVDCTIGFAGHSYKILEKLNNKGLLIGIDLDPYALNKAKEKLSGLNKQFSLHNIAYKEFPDILSNLKIEKVNGFLFDLGISSYQVDSSHRGFSFSEDGPLDMRFNQNTGISAKELLHKISEKDLKKIIKVYGEEPKAGKIAKQLIEARNSNKLNTTFDLKNNILNATKSNDKKILARVFQAIRIAVNGELDGLKIALKNIAGYLKTGGRIVVISFHSLEDRIVKHFFKDCTIIDDSDYFNREKISSKKFNVITKKPIFASSTEIINNSRARSAKLRVAEKN